METALVSPDREMAGLSDEMLGRPWRLIKCGMVNRCFGTICGGEPYVDIWESLHWVEVRDCKNLGGRV